MRLRTLLTAVVLGLFGASLVSTTAWAKKKDEEESTDTSGIDELEIVEIGLPSLDEVFGKAAGLITTLQGAKAKVDSSNEKVATALGLASGTPIADALNDLNEKAGGAISVAMEGSTPSLSAGDAVPENVQAGIDAVNEMTAALTEASAELTTVASEASALVTEASELPGKVKSEAQAAGISSITQIATMLKNTKNNLNTVKDIPDETAALASSIANTLTLVKDTFTK